VRGGGDDSPNPVSPLPLTLLIAQASAGSSRAKSDSLLDTAVTLRSSFSCFWHSKLTVSLFSQSTLLPPRVAAQVGEGPAAQPEAAATATAAPAAATAAEAAAPEAPAEASDVVSMTSVNVLSLARVFRSLITVEVQISDGTVGSTCAFLNSFFSPLC